MHLQPARTFCIHGPRGIVQRTAEPATAPAAAAAARPHTVAARVPITEIMSRHVVCASPDLAFSRLVEVMRTERLGCVPVVDARAHPLGMVTKFDIVEHLGTPTLTGNPLVADIMMPLAITLGDDATVAQAAALMAHESMHHVIIVAERRVVGVVSTLDIARWLADNDRSEAASGALAG